MFQWWNGDASPKARAKTLDYLSKRFDDIFGQAGCVGLKFHDLRHEAVSRLFEKATLAESQIMKISGHRFREAYSYRGYGHAAHPQTGAGYFEEPNAPCGRAYAASSFSRSPRDLSAWMLREGVALTNLICEQRLMRAMFDVSQGKQHGRYGFACRERRNTVFYDRFGETHSCFDYCPSVAAFRA
ncbi:conserved hypothetical protein [Cupriavidus taiwanensis]|nr:conserved hypothetical protein [Cupriavidus taiwanensis]